MPFKWEFGKNPYIFNYFGKLRIGSNTKPGAIIAQAKALSQKLYSGDKLTLAGHEIDEHMISEASAKLREPRSMTEELLLVHSPCQEDESKNLKLLTDKLRKTAVLPDDELNLPLFHPLAIFWFTPALGPEVVELPEWNEFGLVSPGDPEDLNLDVVFDS